MFDMSRFADVLQHLTTQRHRYGLNPTTDAENGYLAVVGQLGNQQFRPVALAVNTTELGLWLLTGIQRVEVGTTAEQQTVDMFQGIDDAVRITQRRDDDRHTTCFQNGFVVAFS